MSNYFQKSLTFGLPSAIAATLGVAIASTGLLYSLSSHAQSGTPGTTTTPTTSPTTPSGGSMGKPDATTTPSGGSMGKPDATTTPSGGSMGKPDATTTPSGGSMGKPDATTTPGDATTKPAKKSTGKTIVDVASKGKFTILVKALKAADLVETLSGEGPYTVFAPTDAAFKKLGSAKLKSLLKPENQEQLKKILTYHVVAGKFTSKMLKSGPVPTVEGTNITVKVKGKNVTINNKTKVTQADIKASNGVIHVIDNVLSLPAN